MRIMGLDIGDKRIGVAVSDENMTMAFPHSVISNDGGIVDNLKKIIKDKNINKIVVGIPRNLKGDIGHQGKKVEAFIEENIKPLGLPVINYDERFTTKICAKEMGKEKKDIDKFSASIILNDYLSQYEK
ncbi:MAG: Holliday junction resolvase RuvX [Actinomycetota bacterium]|nr:Holliday junction resolvase RuvX [Actinomycetota bacterium]